MTRRDRAERGFALLFLLLIAAGIAIALYMELPRVAFETQRNREQLLIERGEQYKRAIGLYVKKFGGRYPAKMEDLENTNNIRFLRRRYVDPMTGKDEWRIVHVGPGGILTDSLIKQNPGLQNAQNNPGNSSGSAFGNSNSSASSSNSNSFGGSMNANPGFSNSGGNTDQTAQDGQQQQQVNSAVLRRASDRSLVNPGQGQPSDPNAPPSPPGFDSTQSGQPGVAIQPGQPGFPQQAGQSGSPNQQSGQLPGAPPGMPQPFNPLQNAPGTIQAQPGQIYQQPGLPQQSVQPYGIQTGLNNQTGPAGGGNGNPAAQIINQILTNPQQPQQSKSAFSTGTSGGGIAGVATTYKGPSIMIYKDQQRYEKWEFIYDPRKDPALNPNAALGQNTGPAQNSGSLSTSQQQQQTQQQQQPQQQQQQQPQQQ